MTFQKLISLFAFCMMGCSSSVDPQMEDAPLLPEPNPVEATTFIESLPAEIQNNILWSADNENQSFEKWEDEGTFHEFSGGGIFNTDEPNIDYGIASEQKNSGSYSSFATIKNVNAPGNPKAVRFMRWTNTAWDNEGAYFPDEAYYSAFFYFPEHYDPAKPDDNDPLNDGGWWNIFQFKSENNAGSQPIAMLDLNNSDGKMYVALIIKDYQNDDSDDNTQEFFEQEHPLEIPPKEWVHLEIFYKKSRAYDGEVKVWQNGELIFEQAGIRTLLPQGDTAVLGLNNYTDYVIGEDGKNESTIYFDDAVVSSVRVGEYLN